MKVSFRCLNVTSLWASRVALPVFLFGFLLGAVSESRAETPSLVVTTASEAVADDGLTSLREAISYVNSGAAGNDTTITFQAGLGPITFSDYWPLTHNVTLQGNASGTVFDGNGRTRFFSVATDESANLRDITFQNGYNSYGTSGYGGALSNAGRLAVLGCAFIGNTAAATGPSSGGWDSDARGGAIYNAGTLIVHNSTFVNNKTSATMGSAVVVASYGGAIYSTVNRFNPIVANCTFTGNAVTGNSTNPAVYRGNAIAALSQTIVYNSILVGNTGQAPSSIAGTASMLSSNNLIDTALNASGLELGINGKPVFKNNGGPTPTIALVPSSPAIDAGSIKLMPSSSSFDQRGNPYLRLQGLSVDIGAYEHQTGSTSQVTSFSKSVPQGGKLALTLNDFTSHFTPGNGALSRVIITAPPTTGNLELTLPNSTGLTSVATNTELQASDLNALSYVPPADFSGPISFRFRAADSSAYSVNSATVTIDVVPPNTAPTISSISNTTIHEDESFGPMAFQVGDHETPVDVLRVSVSSTSPSLLPESAFALGGGGQERTLKITPLPNASGEAVVTLTVTDAGGLSTSTSFALSILPVNDAPVAQSQNVSGSISQEKPFLLTASDPDGDALTYEVLSFSGDGTLGGGRLSGFAPNLSFVTSTPGTYTLTFRAKDSAGAVSNTATVTIVIGSISGQTVSGQVTSSEPNSSYSASVIVPLPNAKVQLEQNGRVLANAATDRAGRYTFYGQSLSAGTYTVHVTAIDTQGTGNPTSLPFVLTQSLKVVVPKKGSVPALLTVPPFTLYSVWGQVNAKSADKKVKTLAPLPGARVQLSKISSAAYPAFASNITADGNGFYLFKYLGRASFNLLATASGLTFKSTKANLPGFRSPAAPSLRLDLTGTPSAKANSASTSSVNSS